MAFLFNIGTELTQEFIFIPLFLHLFLIYWLYIQLGSQKSKAFAAGLVDAKQTALNPKAWPESVVKISNNIGNH